MAHRPAPTTRRIAVATCAVAALGLLGTGLGAASATWTDRVTLAAAGTAATANLQGSIDGGATWLESTDPDSIELTMPAIDDLTPGDTVDRVFQLRNTGTVPIEIIGTVTTSGELFVGGTPGPAVAALLPELPSSIAAGATIDGTLRVTAPSWTGTSHMGDSGTVTITITGTVD